MCVNSCIGQFNDMKPWDISFWQSYGDKSGCRYRYYQEWEKHFVSATGLTIDQIHQILPPYYVFDL